MRHGSLFSGIGGFDLAAQWMGWENIFHCEWNEFGQKVLKHHFPKSISYADITKVDFRHHRGDIDIISGGFPCQPYSSAGKRLGKEDDRHLWPEMLRCIREVSPRWVVGENVLGLVNWNGGLVFDEVQADLEAEGFEVQPYVLPAASVNAPHRRDRVWFVAWNAKGAREAEEREVQRGKNTFTDRVRGTIQGPTINSNERNDRRAARKDERESGAERVQERDAVRQSAQSGEVQRNAPDSNKERLHTSPANRELERERFRGLHQQGEHWKDFPTQSPIRLRDDGISTELDGITFSKWRRESIKGYGNAIVPQVVYEIFKTIEEWERMYLDRNNQH